MKTVLICANWFPVCVAGKFAKAFRQEGWKVLTLGPSYGRFLPWRGGMLAPLAAAIDLPTGPEPSLPWASVYEDTGPVDVLLQFEPHPLVVTVEPGDPPSACYAPDNHVRKTFPNEYDRLFLAHSWGDGHAAANARWLPLGYDPEECFDLELQPRLADVAFVGNVYEHRKAALDWLLQKGLSLLTGQGQIGTQWNLLYNQARAALCWSHSGDLSDRLLANMAQGCVCLVDRGIRDLATLGFKEDLHYLAFGDMYELLDKARLAQDEDLREVLAERAKRQLAGQTWRDRVRQMVKEMGL